MNRARMSYLTNPAAFLTTISLPVIRNELKSDKSAVYDYDELSYLMTRLDTTLRATMSSLVRNHRSELVETIQAFLTIRSNERNNNDDEEEKLIRDDDGLDLIHAYEQAPSFASSETLRVIMLLGGVGIELNEVVDYVDAAVKKFNDFHFATWIAYYYPEIVCNRAIEECIDAFAKRAGRLIWVETLLQNLTQFFGDSPSFDPRYWNRLMNWSERTGEIVDTYAAMASHALHSDALMSSDLYPYDTERSSSLNDAAFCTYLGKKSDPNLSIVDVSCIVRSHSKAVEETQSDEEIAWVIEKIFTLDCERRRTITTFSLVDELRRMRKKRKSSSSTTTTFSPIYSTTFSPIFVTSPPPLLPSTSPTTTTTLLADGATSPRIEDLSIRMATLRSSSFESISSSPPKEKNSSAFDSNGTLMVGRAREWCDRCNANEPCMVEGCEIRPTDGKRDFTCYPNNWCLCKKHRNDLAYSTSRDTSTKLQLKGDAGITWASSLNNVRFTCAYNDAEKHVFDTTLPKVKTTFLPLNDTPSASLRMYYHTKHGENTRRYLATATKETQLNCSENVCSLTFELTSSYVTVPKKTKRMRCVSMTSVETSIIIEFVTEDGITKRGTMGTKERIVIDGNKTDSFRTSMCLMQCRKRREDDDEKKSSSSSSRDFDFYILSMGVNKDVMKYEFFDVEFC